MRPAICIHIEVEGNTKELATEDINTIQEFLAYATERLLSRVFLIDVEARAKILTEGTIN